MIPTTGKRKSVKIFGCVDIIKTRFIYKTSEVFNANTYGAFLEILARRFFKNGHKIQYIQDNVSYHKDKGIWKWFYENRKFIEVHHLPPYCPELNATERLWQYARRSGTHNRYFETHEEMKDAIQSIFKKIQKRPIEIKGYLKPFL